jgi:hypothetical protein
MPPRSPRQGRLVFAPPGIIDLGPVGAGGSGAHFLSINGQQHVGKCPSKSNGRWVCFNEFLAARLATQLGLPVPLFQVVQFQGSLSTSEQWFCSRRMPGANPVPATYGRLVNGPELGAIAVFDIWLCNTDRSAANLWAQPIATGRDKLLIIDHGHTLLTSGDLPSLESFDIGRFLGSSELVGSITNINDVANGLKALTDLPEGVIVEAIEEAPTGWVPDEAMRNPLRDFLLMRRGKLGGMIERNLMRFPNIQRGSP